MKNTIQAIILAFIAIIQFGCSHIQAPKVLSAYKLNNKSFLVKCSLREDDKISSSQYLAIFIKLTAEYYKNNKFPYFWLKEVGNDEIPKETLITTKDLISYCFPSSNGYFAKDFNAKQSNLEKDKCIQMIKQVRHITVYSYAENELNFNKPMWSVDEVLKDKELQKYIDAALKDLSLNNWEELKSTITFK